MRILCVADEFAWPPVNGGRIRLSNALRALSSLGAVDYLAVLNDDRVADTAAVPVDVALDRVQVLRSARRRRSSSVMRAVFGALPRRMLWPDWGEAAAILDEWSGSDYAVAWFFHADAYMALRRGLSCPAVVDLDNLEGRLLRERRASRPPDPTRSRARRLAADALDRLDEIRWARVERRIARTAAGTVVCSELDRSMLPESTVAIVPNVYEPTGSTVRVAEDRPFTIVFVGLFLYEPNRDAARLLAREVLPLVRSEVPDARLRLVGRDAGMIDDLGGLPGVTVVGEVADISPEMVRADVSAMPIRFGGGTRLKILEAFAYRVPVISSAIGAEGIDALNGEHLMLAESPEEMARACMAVHDDADLASRLADSAHALWQRRYRWEAVREAVEKVVGRVLGDAATTPAAHRTEEEAG